LKHGNVSLNCLISAPMFKFRVTNPLPATLRDPDGRSEYVSLPIGSVLTSLREVSSPVLGMFQVIHQKRQYAVLGADLLRKCDPVRA
jgi:hypothetical protein